MRKLLAVIALSVGLAGCFTTDDEARETLDKAGFTNIKTGDDVFFGCGHGDKFGREFTATNANGRSVSGIVCCGNWKSCTVRF